ncbi:MAG TPA: hypothetical protein PLX41_11015, partial [Bacteroidales bacterium]|nr:hypothetical protein [Bacteroidales bacterium]
TVMGLGVSISTGGIRGLTNREHISLSYCLVNLFRWAGQAESFPARVVAITPFSTPFSQNRRKFLRSNNSLYS